MIRFVYELAERSFRNYFTMHLRVENCKRGIIQLHVSGLFHSWYVVFWTYHTTKLFEKVYIDTGDSILLYAILYFI